MEAIVHQLGELFLQAAPTDLIILLFYFILRALFFKPLLAVMAERDARTVGAQKASEAAQAAAGEKVKQYQEALRRARGQVFAEQEAARKELLDERAAQVKEARTKAAGEVSAAKARVAASLPLLAATSKPLSRSFPPKLRAASCKLRRVLALPREKLDDTKSSPFPRCEYSICVPFRSRWGECC